ncbi:MAG: PSD1 domain-containing protein [Verrucomicrobiae bacterium]|nr:PSD1 domain-containing protein [Verrucomicrobiae bacterium]
MTYRRTDATRGPVPVQSPTSAARPERPPFRRAACPLPLPAPAMSARLAAPFLAALSLSLAAGAATGSGPSVSFNRDIRPILSDHCFACHGPDENTRKAGLRLDLESDARKVLRSGYAAIVPGQPDESELLARITTRHAGDLMPPPDLKKPLTDGKIDLLRQWIAQGAPYEGHWAYSAPVRPEPPEVPNASWPRSDLDRFVLARLHQEGLDPTPEAPREKLLRRVTLDLTGLPPTVEDLDAFLADPEPDAYERVVDRLLASPHYGERMAQQWLDLARYGETQGYHHDRHRDLWRWRDWVIQAFNANQPFDEFTVDQLAGDLLPNPSREQRVATGFHRNEMTTSEGGALPEEYLVKYAVGRVDTTARVWLGSSVACAECHDHKYDPISQRDYYRFFAFFYDTPENGLDAEELNPVPRITLETPEQRARADQLNREVAALEASERLVLAADHAEWDAAQAAWETAHRNRSVRGWQPLSLATSRVARTTSLRQDDEAALTLHGAPHDTATYDLTFHTEARDLRGFRLETLPPPSDTRPEPPAGADPVVLSHITVEIHSRDPEREVFPDDAPQTTGWLRLGPFGAASAKDAFDREFGPEKNASPDATFDNGKLRWTPENGSNRSADAPSAPGTLDIVTLPPSPGATYLQRTLTVREGRLVEARLDRRQGVRLWLNDRPVFAQATPPSEGAQADRLVLWLRPGTNRLLVKAVHATEGDTVALHLTGDPVTTAPLDLAAAAADHHAGDHHPKGLLDPRPETGWSVGASPATAHAAFLRTHETFGFKGGTGIRVRLTFRGHTGAGDWDRIRLSVTDSPTLAEFIDLPDPIRASLLAESANLDAARRSALRRFYREQHVPEAAQARQLLTTKRQERDQFVRTWPTAMVMQAASPARETHIRIRGEYDNLGEKVPPGVPEALFPWSEDLPPNRLGLARWLTDPRHPLTARVVVNQYWQKYFGTGLVKTSEDFGFQGEWPSHPELLDWLATEFLRTGWDIKAMQRLIVTSATYRQDSVISRDRLEQDPENRLLTRGPRFRLDAENIRDLAMAASGLLHPKIGGPSVFPYQPPGLWGQVAFEGTRDYVQSEGPDNYRRGLYTYWRRSIPYASFTLFDAPSREVCTVRRPRTNTPLQALALMNDPVYVEAARALAHRVLTHGGSTTRDRVRYAFTLVLGRRPAPAEVALLTAAFDREFSQFAADREAANRLIHVGASRPPVDVDIAELAAWTIVASTLLNLDEAITRG